MTPRSRRTIGSCSSPRQDRGAPSASATRWWPCRRARCRGCSWSCRTSAPPAPSWPAAASMSARCRSTTATARCGRPATATPSTTSASCLRRPRRQHLVPATNRRPHVGRGRVAGPQATRSELARDREGPADAVTEQGQPFDRLVAEHEADVTFGDLAAPAAHRCRRDLLLEQAIRHLAGVEAERGDVEEERPAASRGYRRKAVELPKRLVAAALPFGVRGRQAVGRLLERHPRPDLGEATGQQPAVDVYARDVVREVTGRDDPADPPADHALLRQDVAHRHRAVAHAGQGGRMDDLPAVEQHALVGSPVDEPEIAAGHQVGDRLPLLAGGDPAAGEGRVVDEDGTGPVGHRGTKGLRVEAPPAVDDAERREARDGAHEADPVDHARIGRVGQNDLVARVGDGVQRVEHRHPLTRHDDDLPAAVVAGAAASIDERRDGVLQIVAAGERQPAVRLVLADGRSGCVHRGRRRRDVGVEVLQAKDVRIVAGRGRDAIDAEARDVVQTPNAHRTSARLVPTESVAPSIRARGAPPSDPAGRPAAAGGARGHGRRSAVTGPASSGSARAAEEEVGGAEGDRAALVLVDQLRVGDHDAAVGLGPGRAGLDDRRPQPDGVAGAQRDLPAQLVHPRRAEAGDPGQVVVGEQPHRQPRRVPPAPDQPPVRPAGRELGIDVDRLRVEPPREPENVLLADVQVPVLVHRPDQVVLEPPRPDVRAEVHPVHCLGPHTPHDSHPAPGRLDRSPGGVGCATVVPCSACWLSSPACRSPPTSARALLSRSRSSGAWWRPGSRGPRGARTPRSATSSTPRCSSTSGARRTRTRAPASGVTTSSRRGWRSSPTSRTRRTYGARSSPGSPPRPGRPGRGCWPRRSPRAGGSPPRVPPRPARWPGTQPGSSACPPPSRTVCSTGWRCGTARVCPPQPGRPSR